MNLLAIETATDTVGVALLRDDGGAAELVHGGGREHAERLAPMIEEVCAVAGTPLADVDLVAVDIGPGLFTGLRVGVATAKALAQARDLPVLGITSLDVLGAAAAGEIVSEDASSVEVIVPVVDARRGEVFVAAYAAGGRAKGVAGENAARAQVIDPGPPLDEPRAPIDPEAMLTWIGGFGSGPGTVRVVGDGALRYLHRLALLPDLDVGRAESLASPPPAVLARLAALRLAAGTAAVGAADLAPDYRRPADVRINWEQRPPFGSSGSQASVAAPVRPGVDRG
ncbi:MAG: tRNA (adenosine(37)-N6)-threonylcarbamoyltransferase complex dimerization subunit type 1 TsaB [Acidimicrobiales bacterium]|nr:tRNA (adenosine(37)-N6)-threonylcarbamoyltransferase complex dimerization subunit type 1 TsaB [Acidimicrobiales bacterium]